jgi:hypothetical protein
VFVICCGMYRSGSTWQYQVACELVERTHQGRRIGYFGSYEDFRETTQELDNSSLMLVLKCHDFQQPYLNLIADHGAKAVYSYRDIRDVACSLAWKFARSFDETVAGAELRGAISSYYGWTAAPASLIQRYEQIVRNPVEAVREIATHLSLEIDDRVAIEVAMASDLTSNQVRIERLRESLVGQGIDLSLPQNALLFDSGTLLHWNHIRPADAGDWRSQLSRDELEKLRPVVQQWLIDAGLEHDDRWVSSAGDTEGR